MKKGIARVMFYTTMTAIIGFTIRWFGINLLRPLNSYQGLDGLIQCMNDIWIYETYKEVTLIAIITLTVISFIYSVITTVLSKENEDF